MTSSSRPAVPVRLRVDLSRPSAVVARELRRAIISGAFDGDGRLPPEAELAGELGISRHRLREAIRLLEAEGLVRVKPGRNGGIFPSPPTEEALTRSFATVLGARRTPLSDVFEARLQIESACAALAAGRAGDDDLAELRSLTSVSVDAYAALGDQELNTRFHLAVARAGHNEAFVVIMSAIRSLIAGVDARVMTPQTRAGLREGSLRAHRAIVRAIEARDATKAAERMRMHIAGFWERPEVQALRPGTLTVNEIL